MTRREKVKNWLKKHKYDMALCVCGIALVHNGITIKSKDKAIDALKSTMVQKNAEITQLQWLCAEKDANSKLLMSELLRKGNPLGGKYMAERKNNLKVA